MSRWIDVGVCEGDRVIRLVALACLIGGAACGGSTASSTERCRELADQIDPAEAWADIVELQEDVVEWQQLECDELLANG